jgi:hypothetical protein
MNKSLLIGMVVGMCIVLVIVVLMGLNKTRTPTLSNTNTNTNTNTVHAVQAVQTSQPLQTLPTSQTNQPKIASSISQLYNSTEAPISIQARLYERDRRVDSDNLYPPLSREQVLPRDTYRPVAYLVAEEEPGIQGIQRGDVWKLYARERSRGSHSDFYAVSADRQFDAKVALTEENVTSQPRLRDVYNLPASIEIRHPMFRGNTQYKVVEMDRADWGAMPNYF